MDPLVAHYLQHPEALDSARNLTHTTLYTLYQHWFRANDVTNLRRMMNIGHFNYFSDRLLLQDAPLEHTDCLRVLHEAGVEFGSLSAEQQLTVRLALGLQVE